VYARVRVCVVSYTFSNKKANKTRHFARTRFGDGEWESKKTQKVKLCTPQKNAESKPLRPRPATVQNGRRQRAIIVQAYDFGRTTRRRRRCAAEVSSTVGWFQCMVVVQDRAGVGADVQRSVLLVVFF